MRELRKGGVKDRGVAVTWLIIGLLSAQAVTAASYPLVIPYGRSWPLSVVVDSSRGLAYVDGTSGISPPTGFTFGVINVTSHSLAATLPLDEIPGPMAVNSVTGDVYVAGNDSIEVYRGTSVVGTMATGHQILGMTDGGNTPFSAFFTSGNEVYAVGRFVVGSDANETSLDGPNGIVLDDSNGRLYVSEYLAPQIAVLDASDLSLVALIKLPACCASQFALNLNTQTLYASTGTNMVDIVNAATDQFEKSVQVAPSAQNSTDAITVDSETGRVYVASSPGGSIVELDSSGNVVGHYQVQSQVAGLAVDTRTQELYATNYHQVTVFNEARPRLFLIAIVIGGAAVAVGVVLVFLFLRRRDERERMAARAGWAGPQEPS